MISVVRISAFIAAFSLAGILFAILSLISGWPVGIPGTCTLLAWAYLSQARWKRLERATGKEPGLSERRLWVELAGYSAVTAHLAAALWLAGADLRLGSGNWLAVDSWTLTGAAFGISLAFRNTRHPRDERDTAIANGGFRASYGSLLITLVIFAILLASQDPFRSASDPSFQIGNVLIGLGLLSHLVGLAIRLGYYAEDARHQCLEPDFDD